MKRSLEKSLLARRIRVHPLTVVLALAALSPATVSGSQIYVPFARVCQGTDILCVADAFEVVPAPAPTPEMPRTSVTYHLRVTHVWKGDPPDTLVFGADRGPAYGSGGQQAGWSSSAHCPEFIVGRRYLVVTRYARPGWPVPGSSLPICASSWTEELRAAKAQLFILTRDFGPGRSVVPDEAPIPCVSHRSLVLDLDHGDSLGQLSAVHAMGELGDSSGTALPAVLRAAKRPWPPPLRQRACYLIARWALEDGEALRAYSDLLADADPDVRKAAIQAGNGRTREALQWRFIGLRTDPVAEVRAAALFNATHLLLGDRPPVHEYLESLQDTSAIVRIEAIYALEKRIEDPAVKAALEGRFADPDSEVAAVARKVVGRIDMRRR
jgi:hypothetical protein